MKPILYTCYLKNQIDNFENVKAKSTNIATSVTPNVTLANLKVSNKLLSEAQAQNEEIQDKIKKISDIVPKVENDKEWTLAGFLNYISNLNIYRFLLFITVILVLIIF
jgi:antirestriction protein